MQLGPVVGVRAGSPAEDAGFRAGDVLLSIDGEEVGDPLTLAQRLLPLIGERIEIEVQREDREQPVALRVEPQPPTAYAENFGPGSLLALESLGLALRVENVIQSVDPDGPAFQAGLRAGDEITEVWFLISDEAQRRPPMPPIELSDESPNWPYVHGILQAVAPGTEVEVTYRRRGETHVTQIAPVDSDVAFHAERGLAFAPLRQVRVADSWTESCGIGVHETGRAVGQVFAVLQRLITKRLAVGSLGGPITITAAGTAESSQGPPRLLLFLAFVSVNFAVLCCLPIPGLDGGHLLFLATEGIRRKPVPRKAQLLVSVICLGGLAFLFSLLVVPCLSQLLRLIGLFRTKNGSDSAPRISATSGAERSTAP
jgi:regulator of sigma E protease